MVMLLRAAGFQSEYVAGYTVSIKRDYVDHAWAIVELDGEWYHVDPQLEQNVMMGYTITYRYYLKSDTDMLADHRWGENLISYWSMPEEEESIIREYYTPPICNKSYPALSPHRIPLPKTPDMNEIENRIRNIKESSGRGELKQIVLNVEPPILVAEHHITPPLSLE
jgi:transglutaminase-like putative cysteine protease